MVTRPTGPTGIDPGDLPGIPPGVFPPGQPLDLSPETREAVEREPIPEEPDAPTPLLDFSRSIEESFSSFTRGFRDAGVTFFADGQVLQEEVNAQFEESNAIRSRVLNENSRRRQAKIRILTPRTGPFGGFGVPSFGKLKEAEEALLAEVEQPVNIEEDEEFIRLQARINETNNRKVINNYMFQFWQMVPFAWQSGEFNTFDQALRFIAGDRQPSDPAGLNPTSEANQPQPSATILSNLSRAQTVQLRSFYDETIVNVEREPTEEQLRTVATELVKRPRPKVTFLSAMTIAEIREALTTPAIARVPAGMTIEDVVSILKQNQANDPRVIEAMASTRAVVLDLAQQYTMQQLSTEAIRQQLLDPSLPKLTPWEQVQLAAVQPGLVLAEGLETVFENTTQPWVVQVIRTPGAAPVLFGTIGALTGFAIAGPPGATALGSIGFAGGAVSQVKFQGELSRLFDEQQALGAGFWEANQQAYVDWDTPIGVKIILETVADPTNLWGLGLIGKAFPSIGAASVTRLAAAGRIPILGKNGYIIGRSLGKFEQGFIRYTDEAFRAILPQQAGIFPLLAGGGVAGFAFARTGNPFSLLVAIPTFVAAALLYRRIPKTIQQAGGSFADNAFSALQRLGIEHLRIKLPGKSISGRAIYKEQLLESFDIAVARFISNPTTAHMDLPGLVGKNAWDIGFKFADESTVTDLAKRLQINVSRLEKNGSVRRVIVDFADRPIILIDEDFLTRFNDILFEYRGAREFRNNASVVDAVRRLFGEGSTESFTTVRVFLNEIRDGAFATTRALIERGGTPNEASKSFIFGARDAFVRNASDPNIVRNTQDGSMASIMRYVDRSAIFAGANWLERTVVYPFARHVLLFLNYGVFNVLENAIRTGMRSHNPIIPLIGRSRAHIIQDFWEMGGDTKDFPGMHRLLASDPNLVGNDPIQAPMSDPLQTLMGRAKGEPKRGIPLVNISAGRTIGAIPLVGDKLRRGIGKYIPIDRMSLLQLNEFFSGVGVIQQAHFLQSQYKREMTEQAPEIMAAFAAAMGEPGAVLGGELSSKHIGEIKRALHHATFTPEPGPTVRRLYSGVDQLRGAKIQSDLQAAFEKFVDIPKPIQDMMVDEAISGRLTLESVEDRFLVYQAIMAEENLMLHLETQRFVFNDALNQLSTVAPKNRDEAILAIGELDKLSRSVISDTGALPRAMQMAIKRGRQVGGGEKAKPIFDELFRTMEEYSTSAEIRMGRAIEDMREALRTGFSNTQHFEQVEYIGATAALRQAQVERVFSDLPMAAKQGIRSVRATGLSPAAPVEYDSVTGILTIKSGERLEDIGDSEIARAVWTELVSAEAGRGNGAFFIEAADIFKDEIDISDVVRATLRNGEIDEGFINDIALILADVENRGSTVFTRFRNENFPMNLTTPSTPELNTLLDRRLAINSRLLEAYNAAGSGPRAVQLEGHQNVFLAKDFNRFPEYYGPGGKIETAYTDYRQTVAILDAEKMEVDDLINIVMGNPVSAGRITQPSVGRLTPSDIKNLYGPGFMDDLTNNMIDKTTMTMQTKVEFMEKHYQRAKIMANKANRSPESMGFSRLEISEVYDTILRSMSIDPSTADFDTPMLMALKGMKDETVSTLSAGGIRDETITAFRDYIREVSDNFDKIIGESAFRTMKTREDALGLFDLLAEGGHFGDVKNAANIRKDLTFEAIGPNIVPNLNMGTRVIQWNPEAVGASETMLHEMLHMSVTLAPNSEQTLHMNRLALEFLDTLSPEEALGLKTTLLDGGTDEFITQALTLRSSRIRPIDLVGEGNRPWAERSDAAEMAMRRIADYYESNVGTLPTINTGSWDQRRNIAMTKSVQVFQQEFPDYTNQNAFDAMMKFVYPFWIYESSRFPWLIKHAIQQPGMTAAWGRYNNTSDNGYIPIPGTDLQLNPLRSTVWMGGLRRFTQRDYPEFADAYKTPVEYLDFASRAGFYPGAHIGIPIALFGASDTNRAPQLGEVIPPYGQTLLGAMEAIAPGSQWVDTIRNTLFNDRFRDFQIQDQVSAAGANGALLWNKIQQGTELTQQEQSLWDNAARRVAIMSGVIESQVGMMRLRPDEKTQMLEAIAEGIEELTGVPKELQERSNQTSDVTGRRFNDEFPLDPLDQFVLEQGLQKWKNWLTPRITPLLPSAQGKIQVKVTSYYEEVDMIWAAARETGYTSTDNFTGGTNITAVSLQSLDDQFQSGKITATEYLRGTSDTIKAAIERTRQLAETDYYRDVPKTRKEREEFSVRFNLPAPTFNAGEELLQIYFSLSPQVSPDEDGVLRPDFDTYFGQLEILLDSLPPQFRGRFIGRIQAQWTDMQRLYWDINQRYLRPYSRGVDLTVSEENFTEEERMVIEDFRRAEPAEKDRLRELEVDDTGIISRFETEKRQFRRNLRQLDPNIDAWLLFWGETQGVITESGRLQYNLFLDQYRPSVPRLEQVG